MNPFRKPIAATTLALALLAGGAMAQEPDPLPELMAQLADPSARDWEEVESRIVDLWSRSGSRAMDLLLERGREALDGEDYEAALEHFTALTDHAPNFAEGWNMRATAYYLMDLYELAIADIGRTLALNPQHFGALNGLGIILEQMGEERDALAAYRAAFALNPHRENLAEAIERLEALVDGRDI